MIKTRRGEECDGQLQGATKASFLRADHMTKITPITITITTTPTTAPKTRDMGQMNNSEVGSVEVQLEAAFRGRIT